MKTKRVSIKEVYNDVMTLDGWHYIDDNIILLQDVDRLPDEEADIMKIDMIVVAFCVKGWIQTEINGLPVTISAGDMIVLHNFHTLALPKLSAEISFDVLGMTTAKAAELVNVSSNVMNSIFRMITSRHNHVVHLTEDEIRLMLPYKNMFKALQDFKASKYFQRAVEALLKSQLYVLLDILESRIYKDKNEIPKDQSSSFIAHSFILMLTQDDCRHRKVDYFADRLCISPKYFSTVCQKETGKTPSAWIQERFIERIRHYLTDTTLSIKEITARMDFPNESFFCKYVRRHLGCTPMEYRNQMK